MRIILLCGLCLLLARNVQADGILPGGAEPLSKALKSLEHHQIRPVKVTVEHKHWVIEGISGKESVRITVDPRSGGITKREVIPDLDPIDSSLSMSHVIRKLEEANPGPIYRVHFARHRWIVETKRGQLLTEVELSADTGELLLGKDEK